MSRPHKKKMICQQPKCRMFKPSGVPIKASEVVELRLDELEAIRLSDIEDVYHEKAAELMGTSRPTYSKLLASAHKKIATAIIKGKPLSIDGGNVEICPEQGKSCRGNGKKQGCCSRIKLP